MTSLYTDHLDRAIKKGEIDGGQLLFRGVGAVEGETEAEES
jgi:hypothetical protein